MKKNISKRSPRTAKAWMITPLSIFAKKPLLTLSLVASLAALASGQTKFVRKDPVKIGYSVFDMQQPYWQAYTKGVQDACKAAGCQFILSDQKSNQQAEVSGSIDLINQGISALINSPIEPAALPAV